MRLKFMLLRATGNIAAMKTSFQFPLLDLPNELIAQVIEHVDSRKTLRKLSRTCRRVQQLTEPVLYRYALIRDGDRTRDLLRSIESQPTRAKSLQYLDVPCECRSPQWFDGLARLLETAANLKGLMIEMPQVNNGEFEDSESYGQMLASLIRPFQAGVSDLGRKPLQKLQKLVLHFNGIESPYWTLNRHSICLLQLPSLQKLTLSCVNIGSDLVEDVERNSFTSLRDLRLEECNITHEGLRAILSLPKALEVLYLGENSHNIRHFEDTIDPESNYLFNNDPLATLQAISQQSQSLTSLVYVTPELSQRWRRKMLPQSAVDAGFADFHRLEQVTLHGRCTNFERAVLSSRPPPCLKMLTYQTNQIFWPPFMDHSTENFMSMIPFLRAPSSSVPASLTKLRIVGHRQDFTTSMKGLVEAAAKEMKRVGIKLELSSEDWSSYFPPFLYGEPLPTTTTIFDGDWKDLNVEPIAGLWTYIED